MKFKGRFTKDGMDFGDNRDKILRHAKFNVGKRFILQDLEIKSKNQRGFYEGAVIPLWIYLDGYDHKDSIKHNQYREIAKEEFNPEIIVSHGKKYKKGASTKGKLNGENGIINKVIDFLEEQYTIDRAEVLNPAIYKDWNDRIRMNRDEESFIDYLIVINKLR